MPPSSTPKSSAPSASSPKNSSHYILIALSLIIVAGFVLMYFKMDLLSKNLNTVAQQAEQKTPTPTPAPAPQVAPPVEQTPPASSTITEVYTDPTTGLIFAVPNRWGPENYTFKKESIAGTELVSKISVKRTADGNIPECASWFTVSSVGGPTDPDAVLVTSKYMVSAPAADCMVIVKEKTVWKTYTSENFQFDYPNTLTPMEELNATAFVDATYGKAGMSNPTAFNLLCPMPERGFEAWNFATQKRTLAKNGKTYNVELWLGAPIVGSEDLGHLNLILMLEGNNATSKSSCMLESGNETSDDLYQHIYQSIR